MNDALATYKADFSVAYEEVLQLHLLRLMWKNILGMLQSQPDMYHSNVVNNWLVTCYTRTLAVGIRRQAEGTGTRATVGSLLGRIQKHAELFTREVCRFSEAGLSDPNRDPWVHRYAATTADHLDPMRVVKVREELHEAEKAARRWVNKRVAHLDPTASAMTVTFDDLEMGMSGLRDALKFLFPLFNEGGTLWKVTPTMDLHWIQMFARPWYNPAVFTQIDAFDLG